jgi:hypothetical protein
VVGTVIALALAVVRGETMPLPSDVPWGIVGGVTGGIGIVALYQGLATARMGVVAPITGVLAAAIPVVYGVVVEGLPSVLVVVGISVAIVAVVLVSRVADDRAGPSGIGLALIAGISIGSFGIAISQISEGHTFGPLAIIRTAEGALIAGVILIGRRSWRFERSWLPAMAGVGVLDMAGNAAFILAVQTGALRSRRSCRRSIR